MAINFTGQQQECITVRKHNVLVSAAAGSGKTAVLVERIIRLITDEKQPIDIDRLLVVTFTNAAAAQMKERIAQAINERLEKDPNNLHLKRQETLLHHALITTIDSFCLYIIRNHFNEIGLDPGFRVADPGELKLMKQDLIHQLFEDRLEQEETRESFTTLLKTFTNGTNLKTLEELILRIHTFCESHPWPMEWLQERYQDYSLPEEGIENTRWGKILVSFLEEELEQLILQLREGLAICIEEDGPIKYVQTLEADLEILELLKSKGLEEQLALLKEMQFVRLYSGKMEKVNPVKKEQVKTIRNRVKGDIQTIRKKYVVTAMGGIREQMEVIRSLEEILLDTVMDFRKRFDERKREKNLLDFSDMEHFALDILTCKEGRAWKPSHIAKDYAGYFKEIMIDEYQDSNLVQEYLLQSISGEWNGDYNRFMVGDLKQSIYKFRMARPEIFLEKYEEYQKQEEGRRCISLHSNFRSRKEIIDSVNEVFYQIMDRRIGKIDYTDKEALNVGAAYPENQYGEDYRTQLLLLEESEGNRRKSEANMVARKIQRLVGRFWVTDADTGSLRPAAYKDIVVLLRTNAGWDEVFYQEFIKEGIPVVLSGRSGYFQAREVQTVLNFLRILDNPLQDIPLYGVMTSLPGRFTRDEVARIKGKDKNYLFDKLTMVSEEMGPLGEKAKAFLEMLEKYRDRIPVTPIHKLIGQFLKETGYLYYFAALPGGSQRVANVKMLLSKAQAYEKTSYFGLFHFIRYMEQLQKYEIDESEASTVDENHNAVRIMSIHKSKGLEFPICIVSGLHKEFNQGDTRQPIIMDMDLGIGLEYRDVKQRIKGEDLRRSVIARKQKLENLGEELRILYVAMTRAKEKLILTGVVKDYEAKLAAYAQLADRKEQILPYWSLSHANSYLDFLLAALARPCHSIETSRYIPDTAGMERKEEAVESRLTRLQLEGEIAREREKLQKEEGETVRQLRQALTFSYQHENLRGLYSKTTVSELKMKAMEETDEAAATLFHEEEIVPYIPDFIERREEVSGAARGTAYHRVLELLDYSQLPDWKDLREKMEAWKQEGVLDETYMPMIRKEKMEGFLTSNLAKRMQLADKNRTLFKERPFVLGIPAALLNPEFPEEEKVLVQGIIDAYFEEEGELVLVDYKTDRISTEEELVLRYKEQMLYYKKALEQVTGKRVKEQILYSFALGKEIFLEKVLDSKR